MTNQQPVSPNVGTRLLFENDRVRVWDLRLEPGEATGLHRHETDFLYVVIGDGQLQSVFADGTSDPPRTMHDGEVRFREVEGESVHNAVNVGPTPWRNVVVEFKTPSDPKTARTCPATNEVMREDDAQDPFLDS